MVRRRCEAKNESGGACGQASLQDSDFCFWHDPDHAEEAAEARRLGGLRRRRESTVSGAYDLHGFDSVEDIRRLLKIAVVDTLGLENSVARSRALLYAAQVGARLLETGELEERLAALEESLQPRLLKGRSAA